MTNYNNKTRSLFAFMQPSRAFFDEFAALTDSLCELEVIRGANIKPVSHPTAQTCSAVSAWAMRYHRKPPAKNILKVTIQFIIFSFCGTYQLPNLKMRLR